MSRGDENPFDLQKASYYSSEEILQHWVDISGPSGGLVAILKPASITPMILLGGKGSGKTHLMRFCSAPVQAARYEGSLLKAILTERYAGVYVPAEALNTHKFAGKGLEADAWSAIFSMYFEVWLVTSLLHSIRPALGASFQAPLVTEFRQRLGDMFDIPVELDTLDDLLALLVRLRKQTDFAVNNSAIDRGLTGLEIPFSVGSIIFGVPDLIAAFFPCLGDPTFVYLIDELENFTLEQQKFVNTLIRYRKGRATIKVGARLYGLKTFATLGSGEPIKAGAEFERVELDRFLRDHEKEYRGFALSLFARRLEQARLTVGTTDEALAAAFGRIETSNYWRANTLDLMRPFDNGQRERPHLANLRRKLRDARADVQLIDEVIERLRLPDYPLLEKANTFMFSRQWRGDDGEAASLAQELGDQARALINQERERAGPYPQILSHFSSDLIAQLYREVRQRAPYAGLETLIELSEGIPRNFLGMLALTYRRALFAGEKPFTGGIISVASQTHGVIEGAKFFWDDAQPDADAADVRDAVEALALLFRSIRFSDAPSECDLCVFSVIPDKLTDRSRAVLKTAENWSHILKLPDGRRNKNHRSIDAKYQLSPMLAPLWELSHHRRGSIELQPDLANAIFDPVMRGQLLQLVQSRVAGMNAPRMWQRFEDGGTLI